VTGKELKRDRSCMMVYDVNIEAERVKSQWRKEPGVEEQVNTSNGVCELG